MGAPNSPHDGINQLRDDLARQQRRIRELEKQLAEAINGKLPEDQHLDPDLISISSMVSSQTGAPMVMVRWFTHIAQLPVETARELALNLLDAAEASKADAFLSGFMSEKGPEASAALIAAFRAYRETATK